MVRGLYRRIHKYKLKDGTIRKKEGKTHWMRYQDIDGRMRFESSHTTSFREAQAMLRARKTEVDKGKQPIPVRRIQNVKFKDLAEKYINAFSNQKGFKSKRGFVKQLVKRFGNYELRRFNTLMVEEYQAEILSAGRKNATANRLIATLKHMFNKAIDWEFLDESILRKIRRVKQKQEEKRLRFISIEECDTLIKECKPSLKPIVITALHTGMRKGEILGLDWDKHIDLRHGFILLDKTKTGEKREIPIDQTLQETLRGISRRLDSPYVFTDEKGGRYKDVKRAFNSAIRRAGIKDFRFHDLRHTFASHFVMSGGGLATLKDILGHKSFSMTLRYAHLAGKYRLEAMMNFDSYLTENSTIQKLYRLEENEEIINGETLVNKGISRRSSVVEQLIRNQ